jgi:TPR repeat protein
MERRNAFDYLRGLANLLDRYVHGAHVAMAARFCIALVILLSCCILSAQPLEDPQAQYNRGTDYWNGSGVTQDYVEAASWFRKAAERGYAEAQYRLGQMLAIGQGVREDDTEAANWYRKAADQGVACLHESWKIGPANLKCGSLALH